jgi:branched-chain amino acid aminotransferase
MVNRRTTIREKSSVNWRDEEFSDKDAHAVRSFHWNFVAENELWRNGLEFTPPIQNMSRLLHKIASLYNQFMIRIWKITQQLAEEIKFPDQSSLDAITRQLPEGYYSTFRTYDGCMRVLGLRDHLQRLPGVDASSLRRYLLQLLNPFRPPFGPRARRGETADEARVRIMETKQGQVYIAIETLKLLPREVYENGVQVETTEIRRDSPRIKSTAFIGESDMERKNIAKKGIFEALLVKNGRILEGMTSNFFYIRESVLYTTQRNILLGVTRRTVIRVARGRGVKVRYSPLKLNQLSAIDEAFITSSSRGIVPVVQIDDVPVGQGRVGELTKQLSGAYVEYVIRKAERI